ncbi:MAG: histidine--tRNA ligase [Flavobacteriales bacterium]|nr:histidine--tRNA ligase [Flavobacteriales bacterium]|tara:strand:- start:6911 stop:8284 length:1374 start_codon:yes stop_codon:yes gene_type:complete
MKTNFSLSGIPDFSSFDIQKRDYVLSIIKKHFIAFGFSPISTALIEKRSNLFGSYGEDGEKLIFQILKSGDYLSKTNCDLKKITSNELSENISDKALRYDLTVSFARFFSQNQSDINLPFRRYEIGPVFRADRPQKGRLRQFTQCDADIIGSKSLLLEVDLISLIDSVLTSLKLNNMVIKISNRKILEGIFQSLSINLNFSQFSTTIDKLDKIGLNKVCDLLSSHGLPVSQVKLIKNIFSFEGTYQDKKTYVLSNFNNKNLKLGFDEISFIFSQIDALKLKTHINLDFSLARGLDYYTGSIFEVVSSDNNFGSICGGGRYDQLTEKFNINNISGVGMSFGLDRLCILLDEFNLFPNKIAFSLDYMFINFGEETVSLSQYYMQKLRMLGASVEIYPEAVKINKQLSYANKRGVKFVIMIGEEEAKKQQLSVKNMIDGSQELISFETLIKKMEFGEKKN